MKREILLDARDLLPPEPMERVMLVLDRLQPGEHVRFLVSREPVPLYPILHQKGYRFQTHLMSGQTYEVLIYPKES